MPIILVHLFSFHTFSRSSVLASGRDIISSTEPIKQRNLKAYI